MAPLVAAVEQVCRVARRGALAMLFNFVSSVGLVNANKRVFESGFSFAATLTCWHYAFTSLGLLLLSLARVFDAKRLDARKCVKLALGNISFVVFSNLSLQYNSMAFYQLMKHLSTPVVVFLEMYVYGQRFDSALMRALAVMMIGVMVAFATDFRLNAAGTLFALVSVAASACYAVWIGKLQQELGANPLQLQLYVSPMVAALLLPAVLVMDLAGAAAPRGAQLMAYEMTAARAWLLFASGAAALCVNVSVFMVIGYTSSVTYSVLGIAKTSAVVLCDYLFFARPVEPLNLGGIAVALVGVTAYSMIKVRGEKSAVVTAAGGGGGDGGGAGGATTAAAAVAAANAVSKAGNNEHGGERRLDHCDDAAEGEKRRGTS